MLCAGNSELEVDIKRGILKGDSLPPLVFVLALIPLSLIIRNAEAAYEFSGCKEKINHLLFMNDLQLYSRNEKELDPLVQLIHIFSEDIGMEVGIEKCAMLAIKKGKIVKSVAKELPDLGILDTDTFLGEKMKLKVSKEYFRRLRKVL